MADPYDKLRKLLDSKEFPMLYPFKLIVKNDAKKLEQIKQCFDETVEYQVHTSRKGNYKAITVKQMMMHPDDIIRQYRVLEKIDVLISL